MKLNALILTSALMMTASMQAMEQQESTPILPAKQSLPADCIPAEGLVVNKEENIRQQAFKLQQQVAVIKAAKASQKRKVNAAICISAICCCPCLVLECISDMFCPKTIVVVQNSSSNNQ
jgi:hypothetical protein